MSNEFDAVCSGNRQRARWRCAQGWVRVQRLSDHHIRVQGPRREVRRLATEVSAQWSCLLPELDALSVTGDGDIELMLMRNDTHMATHPARQSARRLRMRSQTMPA
jgi:hypothetical protein